MKIVVGIGNPGKQYAATRHNVGFMVVERMAEDRGGVSWRRRFDALAAELRVGGAPCVLMKPETYVNESGRAVGAAVKWFRADLQDVLVVCDDLNLPLGRLRIRSGGGSGGHNGLASVAERLGSEDVPRLRIGIGLPEAGADDKEFVLSPFAAEERDAVNDAVACAVQAVEMWLRSGLERCQNAYNTDPKCRSGKEPQNKEVNA